MVWYSSQSEVLLHSVVDWDPFYSQLTTLTRREGEREGGGGRDKGSEEGREEGEEGREGRMEEEKEVGRKDGEKKRNRVIVRQRNNMRCIPTTNRECIRCQYHYTKQTLTMATVPSLAEWNVYMIPMFTQKGCTWDQLPSQNNYSALWVMDTLVCTWMHKAQKQLPNTQL